MWTVSVGRSAERAGLRVRPARQVRLRGCAASVQTVHARTARFCNAVDIPKLPTVAIERWLGNDIAFAAQARERAIEASVAAAQAHGKVTFAETNRTVLGRTARNKLQDALVHECMAAVDAIAHALQRYVCRLARHACLLLALAVLLHRKRCAQAGNSSSPHTRNQRHAVVAGLGEVTRRGLLGVFRRRLLALALPHEHKGGEAGGSELDIDAHEERIDGRELTLSFEEFERLNYFVVNQGVALSREKILNNVWNYDYFGDARTIDTHVKKLRSKLGEKGEYIKTIWGMGYKFEVD